MRIKDFITRQRVAILILGALVFFISITVAGSVGHTTLIGSVLVDLAASAVTVIFTAFIIDYLNIHEKSFRTKNAAGLAEDEIKFICFRIKWRMARLFGLPSRNTGREEISTRIEAHHYLEEVGDEVDTYLNAHAITFPSTPLQQSMLAKYSDRLEIARNELEQTLMLYEFAMTYTLRERVLNLRSELQIADNMLGFLDFSETLNEANASLIRILSQSIYNEIEAVLGHDSRTQETPIHAKTGRLA
jgi:hypothetical protein